MSEALRLAVMRIAIGFLQGLSLYALDTWGGGLMRPVFAALQLTALLGPVAALAALGALKGRWLWIWLGGVAAAFAGLGAYDGFIDWWVRDSRQTAEAMWPRPATIAAAAVAAFISYQLTLIAQREGSFRTAAYEAHFDEAWKDGVRLGLGVAFLLAMWLVLLLGSELFKLIGLKAIAEVVQKPWFAFPATTTFFAVAAHITDTRAGLVKGARTLALTLLSWLMPLMTLIVAGFVVALLFTGLEPLWKTGHAGAILLAATAALILLINATYQDGERDGFPPAVLKWAVRIAAVLLTPLVIMAGYGVVLRIGQYGLTPERVYSLACLVIAAAYAGGYLWAAVLRGPWMKRLERVNVTAAYLVVAVILAVFSPLIDPARLSVANQVARLERGGAKAETFDFTFLRWEAGRWGRAALERIASESTGVAKERANAALEAKHRYQEPRATTAERTAVIVPLKGVLPPSFLSQNWDAASDPARLCDQVCRTVVADLNGDGEDEVAVFMEGRALVYGLINGHWSQTGSLSARDCKGHDPARFKADAVTLAPRQVMDVDIGGVRFAFEAATACEPTMRRPPRD